MTKVKQSLSTEITDSLLELTGISFYFNGSQNSASSIYQPILNKVGAHASELVGVSLYLLKQRYNVFPEPNVFTTWELIYLILRPNDLDRLLIANALAVTYGKFDFFLVDGTTRL